METAWVIKHQDGSQFSIHSLPYEVDAEEAKAFRGWDNGKCGTHYYIFASEEAAMEAYNEYSKEDWSTAWGFPEDED